MALLCSAPATTPASEVDTEELGGWKQDYIETPKSRDELDVSLPDYPQEKNLMDLGIATDGMQYTVYLANPLYRGVKMVWCVIPSYWFHLQGYGM